MVSRAPAETSWLGRLAPVIIATLLGTAQTGIVIYFSSQRATIDDLQKSVAATSARIDLLKQEMDMNKARRDEQMNGLAARLGQRR